MKVWILLKLGIITFTVIMLLFTCQATSNLHPLVIVPGSGGNQLEARLTSGYKATSLVCNRWYPLVKQKGGWFRLWFDPSVLLAPFTECFADRMILYYDKESDDYFNAPGIETRVPDFGSTRSLLYLDPNLKQVTQYMATLVESLEKFGYKNGKSLFGAPYDFRHGLAAKGHSSKVGSKFLQDLKALIEKASDSNGGKPVIILSHSLGGLFVLQLLNRNSLTWRKKYIKNFVALSAPWGGSVELMLTLASGNTLGVPFVDPLLVRGEQRTTQTNLWLLPNPNIFGTKQLVFTPNATYSSYEIAEFLDDIGFPEGVYPYKSRILPLMDELIAPGVPITCIIGSGVKTPESLIYSRNGFDEQPEVVYGDGDGTVNLASLLALETMWSSESNKNQHLKVINISGVSHTSILKQDIALDEIIREISCINSNVLSEVL